MKKLFFIVFLIFIFLLISGIFYLSVIGVETTKFNNLIVKEIKKKNSNIDLQLEKIKIKLDLKKIQLFLSTNNPKIKYYNIKIPITEIKIYSELSGILTSKISVSQIVFEIEKFKTKDLQEAIIRTKPSNFKTFLLNNLYGGEIKKALFDLNLDEDFKITEYKASGTIKKVNTNIKKDLIIENISFNFIVDNNLALINSITANYNDLEVSNGSIDLQIGKATIIKGKFKTQFNLKENQIKKLFKKIKFFEENKVETKGALLHKFNLELNNNFKITKYDYQSSGKIIQSKIVLKDAFKSSLIARSVKKILFKEIQLEINLNKINKNSLIIEGLYSTDELIYKKFKIKNNLDKKNKKFFVNFNISEKLFFNIINFQTDSEKISNIKSEFSIKNNKFIFKLIEFTEGKNSISIKKLILNNRNEIEGIDSVSVLTFDKRKKNNNFKINFGEKISILGEKYDSSNLLSLLSGDSKPNTTFKNFTSAVEIKINTLITKSQIPLRNLNLIGAIKKGKFNNISAKSEFSENQYLDISLKKSPNNKKILEVYSDYPQALLANYGFFEGIKGGKLLYNSIIDEKESASKLTIENFKLDKAPAFATLLTLADLGGIADLLSGEGMSFDFLEINLKDDSNTIVIEEVLALGSSISLHMKGYIEKKTGLVSFSGTLVPAKMLNSLVSKIPMVGNILVGRKMGEGIFGVSFKIKGLPGKVKSSVNPVKTLTPRFITRALEKIKKN